MDHVRETDHDTGKSLDDLLSDKRSVDEIEEDVDGGENEEDSSTNLLAELGEEQKTHNQLTEVRQLTVVPGVMRLNVKKVATTEDSGTVTITTEHPMEGEITHHLSKPRTWDEDNELVQFLDWYNLTIDDIYNLQTRKVFVDCSAKKTRDWELTRPPDIEDPWTERAKQRLSEWDDALSLGEKFMAGWTFSLFTLAALIPMLMLSVHYTIYAADMALGSLFIGICGFFLMIVGLIITEDVTV